MGLLEDFETLEKQQIDSIEYFLRQLVLKDQSPELIECIESVTTSRDQLIKSGKVYIIFELDEKNREFKIVIGDVKELRCITLEDYHKYVELYKSQYPNRDASYLYSSMMRYYLFVSSLFSANEEDFIYCTDNHGSINSKYSRRNYRIKFQQPTPTHAEAYEKYIPTIKIDYSK